MKYFILLLIATQVTLKATASPVPLSSNAIKSVIEEEVTEVLQDALNDVEQKHDSNNDESEIQLVKGKKIKAGIVIPTEYEVSFQVLPLAFKNGWHNVLHFTTGGDLGTSGYRIPGVWFHTADGDANSRAMYVCSDVNGKDDYCFTSHRVPVQKWTSIKIKQIKTVDDIFLYEIFVDGKIVHSVVNTLPKTFTNVNLYTSDPWYPAQVGHIKDLYYGEPKKEGGKPQEETKQSSFNGSLNFHLSFNEMMKLMDRFTVIEGKVVEFEGHGSILRKKTLLNPTTKPVESS